MSEEWRTIIGYEGLYEISNLGRVKSLERVSPRQRGGRFGGKAGTHSVGERILKAHTNYAGGRQGGRLVVVLCRGGIMRQFQVHRLVAQAFIPNPDNLSDASHIDHNPLNNSAENLEWLSHRDNIRDSVQAGRWRKKLSEESVLDILKRARDGEPQIQIAKSLGLAYGTINSIVTGRSWKHLSSDHMAITEETVSQILKEGASGKSPAEILASLPRKRKMRKTAG